MAVNMLLPTTLHDGIEIAIVLGVLQLALVALLFRQTRLRAKAEDVAAKSQERLALISSMSGFGFWSWDAATGEVWASKHSRAILALSQDGPLSGQSLLAAIHSEDRPRVLQTIKATECPNTMEMELRVAGPGGEIRWITAKASAYRDPKGTVNRVAGYVFDDSERK
jgi:PAS domain S-box-containing protein